MPTALGAHADRLRAVAALLAPKGRREQGCFAFEGPTLLDDAHAAGVVPSAIYATPEALAGSAAIAALERAGSAVFTVDARAMRKISDVESPSGIVAVATQRLLPVADLAPTGLVLLLADIGDPGNAGTLLRSAEAFGARAAIFGDRGVDPYHPKVVRAAMGAHFRLPLGRAAPEALLALGADARAVGLEAGGRPLDRAALGPDPLLVVGNERHGLGRWEGLCARRVAIPMRGLSESLNAAIAGSIALFVAAQP